MTRLAWLVCGALAWVCLAPPAAANGTQPQDLRDAVARWTTPPPGPTPPATSVPSTAPRGRRLERRTRQGWGLDVRSAFLHQTDTDLDGGGRFNVNRVFAQASLSYSPAPGRPLTVSLGYRFDGYDFGRAGSAFPARPWRDVHSVSVSIPLFVPISERWFLLAIPTIRSSFESGAAWEDGLAGGGIIGASYKVNDRLRIGPGIGVLTQLEDDLTVFPFVLVDWELRQGLRLKTGRGLGATQGPGVFLEWEASSAWTFAVGGRFDRLRFRLDRRGVAPHGIGEDSSVAAVFAASWQPSRRTTWSASVGVAFAGELRIEDRSGALIQKDDYDAAAFFGLGFQLDL